MNVLILGSGGREHALAWKIAKAVVAINIYCTRQCWHRRIRG